MASEGKVLRRRVQLLVVLLVLLVASVVVQAAARSGAQARWLRRAGLWCTVAALGVACAALVAAAPAALQEALGPVALGHDLAELADFGEFQSRVGLLSRSAAAPTHVRWTLRLQRVLSERGTHIVFEAVARRGDEEVPLWGKRYKVAGCLKALQRLLVPAYDSATWGILCRMHACGLGGPVPVAFLRLRRRGVQVGSILVAEHLGEPEPVKRFLRSGFALLPPEQRRGLLMAVARFVNRLHAAGIYDFTPRYLYATGLGGPAEALRLCLCDLDKAHLLLRAPRWLRRLRRRRDLRRLVECVQEHGTPDEVAAFERELAAAEGDGAGAATAADPAAGPPQAS